ncbi:MAG: photosynthetic reaction center subunit H [Burkholderiales bacterium]|nr:photosynthetic reaction center subunit H [Burkholderiales bacterium]
MPTGAITGYMDVAQLVLYAFWIFFAGLIYYLHRENKREGYPLESDRTDRTSRVQVVGFPSMPAPKTYKLPHGGEVTVPNDKRDARPVKAAPVAGFPGAALEPTGDPLADGVGPAAWAERADRPDLTLEGEPKIVPLRVAADHYLESRDPDPRGMRVVGADGKVAGVIRDVWIDRSEVIIRYLEAEVGGGNAGRRVLVPMNLARIRDGAVHVKTLMAHQIATVPGLAKPDQVTLREEDRICAYYAGGTLYAEPRRQEPWL